MITAFSGAILPGSSLCEAAGSITRATSLVVSTTPTCLGIRARLRDEHLDLEKRPSTILQGLFLSTGS